METDIDDRQERGVRSPGYSLSAAVELASKLKSGVGLGPAARETAVQSLGYQTLNGRSNRALGALSHFGFIGRAGASAIQISDLGKRVLMPRDDSEYREALVEAAVKPSLYEKLYDRFAGHAVPGLLPNILVREFGVHPNTAEDVAKIFRESAEFAGLLRNGVLYREPEVKAAKAISSDAVVSPDREAPAEGASSSDHRMAAAPLAPPVGSQRYTIPLDQQGRVATIDIPLPMTANDLRRIGRWAEFMSSLDD